MTRSPSLLAVVEDYFTSPDNDPDNFTSPDDDPASESFNDSDTELDTDESGILNTYFSIHYIYMGTKMKNYSGACVCRM